MILIYPALSYREKQLMEMLNALARYLIFFFSYD